MSADNSSVADGSSGPSKAQGDNSAEPMDVGAPAVTVQKAKEEVIALMHDPSKVYKDLEDGSVKKENLKELADQRVYVAGALPPLRKPFINAMIGFTFLMKLFTPLGLAISTLLTDMTHWEVFGSKIDQKTRVSYSRTGRSYFEYPIKRCIPSCFRALVEEMISLHWICPMVGCMSGPFYQDDPTGMSLTLSGAAERTNKEQALADFADHWLNTHADKTKCQVLCCDTTDADAGCETTCGKSTCAFTTESAAVDHWRNNRKHSAPYKLRTGKKLAKKDLVYNMRQSANQQAEIDTRLAKFRELQALKWGIMLPVSAIVYPKGFCTLTTLEALQQQRVAENRTSLLHFSDLQSDSPADLGNKAAGVPQLELVFRRQWMHGLDAVLAPFTMAITKVIQWSQDLTDEEVVKGIEVYTSRLYDLQRPITNDELLIFPPDKRSKLSKGKRKHSTETKTPAPQKDEDSELDVPEKFGPATMKRQKVEWGSGTGKRVESESCAEDLRRTRAETGRVGKNKQPLSPSRIFTERLENYYRLEGELLQMKRTPMIKNIRERIMAKSCVTLSHCEHQVFTRFHRMRVDRTIAFLQLQHVARCLHRSINMDWGRQREQEAGYNLVELTQSVEENRLSPLMDDQGYIEGSLAQYLPAALHGENLMRGLKKDKVVDSADETHGVSGILAGTAWPNNYQQESERGFQEGLKSGPKIYEKMVKEAAKASSKVHKDKMYCTPKWNPEPKDSAGPGPAEPMGKIPGELSISVSVAGDSSGSSKAQRRERIVRKTTASATATSSDTVKPHDLSEFEPFHFDSTTQNLPTGLS